MNKLKGHFVCKENRILDFAFWFCFTKVNTLNIKTKFKKENNNRKSTIYIQ